MKQRSLRARETTAAWIFVLPWLLGLLLFVAGPIITSFIVSFTDWDLLTRPKWIGAQNYKELLGNDPLLWQSVKVSAIYTFASVPLGMGFALLVALGLNRRLPGLAIFRTIYYLPAILSGVAVAMLWQWVFSPEFGLINTFLRYFSLPAPGWLASESWALPALIIMGLWGIGGTAIIYLSGLQNIPDQLYEAAMIDGAGPWKSFRHVTIPMLSPVLFFTLIMGIIGSFQVFTQAYVMTNGGPANATLFFVLYLYRNAFEWLKMGYASALAWLLFVIILSLTLLNFALAKYWVHYED
ncbi:MAG: sugar ABC transporter permease [bacterium]|nr:sugar ABC transporter permease [Candidatus Sumerlaeota bacterium]